MSSSEASRWRRAAPDARCPDGEGGNEDAAIEALPVAAAFVWTCESWSDHSAIVLRSTVDSLTVARAVATSLGRRVIVGLALRGEPGWVILDPGEREWIGEGWRWYDELRFVRLFDEGDVIG